MPTRDAEVDAPPGRSTSCPSPGARAERVVLFTELLTGGLALVSGALLAVHPDGSLLGLSTPMLAHTPFSDWRLPGVLLATGVGVGFCTAAVLRLMAHRWAGAVSVLAGLGLVAFEVVEWRWLGFHPLQAVFIAVGAAVAVDAGHHPRRPTPGSPPRRSAMPRRGRHQPGPSAPEVTGDQGGS